ncbi:hypothetical protein [Vulcanococcus limneticus]|uniref:hypothetical protein n=1 Tax=Vulcanococcus limneticus TaxID=2170428 RepID=UPI00398BE845
MDSDPPPRSLSGSLPLSATRSGAPQTDPGADASEDPDSCLAQSPSDTLLDSGAPLIGALIALATLLLPLASVLSDRSGLDTAPPALRRDGSAQPAGLAGTRPGEPGGGDPRRQPQ